MKYIGIIALTASMLLLTACTGTRSQTKKDPSMTNPTPSPKQRKQPTPPKADRITAHSKKAELFKAKGSAVYIMSRNRIYLRAVQVRNSPSCIRHNHTM